MRTCLVCLYPCVNQALHTLMLAPLVCHLKGSLRNSLHDACCDLGQGVRRARHISGVKADNDLCKKKKKTCNNLKVTEGSIDC